MKLKAALLLLSLAACRPRDPCLVDDPLPPPVAGALGGGLDGFDSPYLGHNGSWNGTGGELNGDPKIERLDLEVEMGLRWTFMPVFWQKLEPLGPVDASLPSAQMPPEWQELDAFVVEAQARGLNILMQPTIGGNAKGAPSWAGSRDEESNTSAPEDMDGLVNFMAKLVTRYKPGGILATEKSFADGFGVRAWEMDNEPEFYRKFDWGEEPGDYAEFFVKSAEAMKLEDPLAVIVGPGIAHGDKGIEFLTQVLDEENRVGSATFEANFDAGQRFSIGPSMDVVSFHIYEGNNFDCIDCRLTEVRDVVEQFESQPTFGYATKTEYWHTEGNYQFLKMIKEKHRAAWRWQFMTRAFAAGVHKINVMDPGNKQEIVAIKKYVELLPDPFPMLNASSEVTSPDNVFAFRHPIATGGNLWVVWADNGRFKDNEITVPVAASQVTVVQVDASEEVLTPSNGSITLQLKGKKISPPQIILDVP